mgnify:FL=1|jgi:hypothetical protein
MGATLMRGFNDLSASIKVLGDEQEKKGLHYTSFVNDSPIA